MQRCFEEEGRGILDEGFVSLREAADESKDVAADDECGGEECEAVVWERGGGVGKEEVFKREVDERREQTEPDREKDEDVFGRKEFGEG